MKDFDKDYLSFLEDSSNLSGSPRVWSRIQRQIQSEVVNPLHLGLKVLGAHGVASVLTLMSCSQFGVRLVFDGSGLMHYFMHWAPRWCFAFCGLLYFIVSLTLIRTVVHDFEWRALKKHKSLGVGSLAVLTLAGFAGATSQVTWQHGLLWLLGAALGASLVFVVPAPLKPRPSR